MLNGKRMNRSALVQVFQGGETELSFGSQGPDLGSIPSIAIKSLEILRDGASAQYGSDAIAGVLNFHFRDNPSGIEVTSRFGEYFPGHGYSKDGWDRTVAANVGLPLGGQGFFNISAEWSKNQQTIRNATRILPGIVQDSNGGTHLNGAAENQTLYTLDGFNISDPLTGKLVKEFVPVPPGGGAAAAAK